jgi:hypothetical protein
VIVSGVPVRGDAQSQILFWKMVKDHQVRLAIYKDHQVRLAI